MVGPDDLGIDQVEPSGGPSLGLPESLISLERGAVWTTGRYPQGTRLAILLGDVDASDGFPDPITVPQELADCSDLHQAHPINGFPVDPLGQGTIILADLGVCLDEKVFATEMSIYPLQIEPALSSLRKDFDQLTDRLHSQHSQSRLIFRSSQHLPPFVMSWTLLQAFGYYGGSVAMGLAPFRRSRIPFDPTYRARDQDPISNPSGLSLRPRLHRWTFP